MPEGCLMWTQTLLEHLLRFADCFSPSSHSSKTYKRLIQVQHCFLGIIVDLESIITELHQHMLSHIANKIKTELHQLQEIIRLPSFLITNKLRLHKTLKFNNGISLDDASSNASTMDLIIILVVGKTINSVQLGSLFFLSQCRITINH